MDTNLESALDCLRDIKRKDLHAQKELDSVQKEIAAARERLRELKQQRKDIATEKTHALVQSFPSALRRYSAGWSLPFFDLLQQRLPRELRDMVYAHIWDKKTLVDTSITMTSIMRDGCSAEPEECQDAMICDSKAIKGCTHGQVPYFVKPAFTGQESAREMIEAWCSRIHGANPNIAMGVPLDHVPSILQHDRFHVGLKPAAVLRKLAVIIRADELIADLEHDSEKEKLYGMFFTKARAPIHRATSYS